MALPIDQWHDSLNTMEAALTAASRALDRAEERWELAAAPCAGEGEPPPGLDRIDARLEGWSARLQAAAELSAAVESELSARSDAITRWLARYAQWEELLQRREHTSPVA